MVRQRVFYGQDLMDSLPDIAKQNARLGNN